MDLPTEPIIFNKAPSSYSGPDDDVLIPRGSTKTDWEVELGIVIGRSAEYLPDEEAAMAHVAGYCICNDVSERDFQLNHGPTWVKGKSARTFCPTGPWLVTPDEVPDPQSLAMSLTVNGEVRQSGSTATMIFGVAHLVHYISQFMVLEAGDLIATGNPARRRHGHEASGVPQGRRRDGARDRGPRPPAADAPPGLERVRTLTDARRAATAGRRLCGALAEAPAASRLP